MSYDKIKNALSPEIFSFWSNCNDKEIISSAYFSLKSELEQGILPNQYKYHAELQFLKLKLGLK